LDANAPTWWWLATGALVAAELATGTFYLLMVALGAATGAIAAHLGAGSSAQIVVAAIAGGGATAAWHFMRMRGPRPAPAQSNRDVNLDIGQIVNVPAWGTDGLARVSYRGAAWTVRFAGPGDPAPGDHVIVAVQGSQLQVAPATAQ
jgi:membrane protein implicated in regulation of membrane protease activity